jgi:hypothetical protein
VPTIPIVDAEITGDVAAIVGVRLRRYIVVVEAADDEQA